MPPQPTNITAEGDTTGLALELPIALAKDARGDAATAARLSDARAGNDAVGPAATSTRTIMGLFRRHWRAFQERRQHERLRATLADLADRELMDLGLTRGEIDYITPQRAIDRLRDNAHLWSRGVM